MDGEIDPDELADVLETDGEATAGEADGTDRSALRIVDIRDERSFDRGHLPDSESIPFPELTNRVDELAGADRIVTVCPHGIASRQAAQLIASYEGTADARVESLSGGIEAWQEGGRELEPTPETDADADDTTSDAPF